MHYLLCLSFISGFNFTAWANLTPSQIQKNGVVQAGEALLNLIDDKEKDSLFSRCTTESRSARYFSNSCSNLIVGLKKQMNRMVMESDFQMQAEKLSNRRPSNEHSNHRLAMLAKINLLATQAEETIKTVQNTSKNSDNRDDIPDLLPAVKKVELSFLTYLKLLKNEN